MRWLLLLASLIAVEASAAIGFVSLTNSDAANDTTRTVTEGSWNQNDVIQCLSMINNNDGAWSTVPADFTAIDASVFASSGAPSHEFGTWYKVRGATAGNALTYTTTATSGSIRLMCWSIREANTTTPFATTFVEGSHFNNATSNPTLAPPSIAAENGDLVVTVWVGSSSNCSVAGPPPGYTLQFNEVGTGNSNRQVAVASKAITTGSVETPSAWTHTCDPATDNSRNFIFAYNPAVPPGPVFTVGPTITAATKGYNVAGTVTGSGTLSIFGVAVNPAAPAPTCTQVKAGQDGNGTAAHLSASEVWTTGVGNDFDMTSASATVSNDVHVCASDGSIDTAVTSSNDLHRAADAGQQIIVGIASSETGVAGIPTDVTGDTTIGSPVITGMTDAALFAEGYEVTVSAGFSCSPFCAVKSTTVDSITLHESATSSESNITTTRRAFFNPSVASGDVWEVDSQTLGACNIAFATDSDFSWSGCSGYEEFDYCVQDVSAPSNGSFITPPCWATDATVYINNTPPELDIQSAELDLQVFTKDATITPIDFNNLCFDADGHSLTVDFVQGTLPTGLTMTAGVLSGAPTVENETGVLMTARCADEGGLVDYEFMELIVIETVAMPQVTNLNQTDAINAILEQQFWRLGGGDLGITLRTFCSGLEASNEVLASEPVATTEMGPYDPIVLDISVGAPCARRRR